jgi:hypothetical protein
MKIIEEMYLSDIPATKILTRIGLVFNPNKNTQHIGVSGITFTGNTQSQKIVNKKI